MAKLCHAQRLGYHVDSNTRILVTGGASENQTILQVHQSMLHLYSLSCVLLLRYWLMCLVHLCTPSRGQRMQPV